MEDFIFEFIQELPLDDYKAVGLIGSYATGQATTWSDVDIVIITDTIKDNYVKIFKEKYFTVSFYTPDSFEAYFKDPFLMFSALKALEMIKPLYDPEKLLEDLVSRCQGFKIGSVAKEHAKFRAKNEYIGFMEEAQKAIQGLKDHHVGKMLSGLYGLTYGMFTVIRLRDQLTIASDNDFYDVVMDALDDRDPIKELAEYAFGIKKGDLEDQVEAGLEMFMHIGNSLVDLFSEEEKVYALKLVHEIIKVV